jgi:predicted DNA-binding transcriptional regulator AlpA
MDDLPPMSAVGSDLQPVTPWPSPWLLTAAEAAAQCRTSVRTWRSWDASGRVPRPIRIGRAKLWRPLELADWIAAGCPPQAAWEWEPRTGRV